MGPMMHWVLHLMRYISTRDYRQMLRQGISIQKISILALCLHIMHEDYDIHRHESLSEDKSRVKVDTRNHTLQHFMLAATVLKAGMGQLDAIPIGSYRSLSTWPQITPTDRRNFKDQRIFCAYLERRHQNVFLHTGIAVVQHEIIGYNLENRLKSVRAYLKKYGIFNYAPAVGGVPTSGTEFRHFRCMNIFFELQSKVRGAPVYELTADQFRMIRLDGYRMYRTEKEKNDEWQRKAPVYLL